MRVMNTGSETGRSTGRRATRWLRILTLASLLALAAQATAGTILSDDFETGDPRWLKNTRGEATIEIVDGGLHGKCLKVWADGGLSYYTAKLDAEKLAGTTIEIHAMVKLDDVRLGPQSYSTAKFHVGQRIRGVEGVQNAAARWTGTADWQKRILRVDIDEAATEIVLDIGIQNGAGTVYFDDLVVQDTFGKGRPVALTSVANRGRSDGVASDGRGSFLDLGMDDLFELPVGNLDTDGATFYIPAHGDNMGRTCVILKGKRGQDFPAQVGPVPVGKRVAALHFLHASAWADTAAQEPTLTYIITFADGQEEPLVVRAGVDIANFDDPRELANCKPVWSGTNGAGKRVGVGMMTWENPRPKVAVKSLSMKSAGNGVPIILAVTYTRPAPE